jgi:hypothetical protein
MLDQHYNQVVLKFRSIPYDFAITGWSGFSRWYTSTFTLHAIAAFTFSHLPTARHHHPPLTLMMSTSRSNTKEELSISILTFRQEGTGSGKEALDIPSCCFELKVTSTLGYCPQLAAERHSTHLCASDPWTMTHPKRKEGDKMETTNFTEG